MSETAPTVTYTYDKAGRVQSQTASGEDGEKTTVSYTYDIYGNTASATDAKGNTTLYRYDGNGNLLETEDAAGRVFYSRYDALNRVVETGMRSPDEPGEDIVLTNTELYANEVAKKYGINLKGSGQKVNILFNPELKSSGMTREKTPNVIELGPGAFVSEEELANTIAHELNHARSFLKGGDAPEWGKGGAYPAGNALEEYIRGKR